jgi:hypothetical protein
MDNTALIGELTESYTRQVQWYIQLKIIVQRILGQIALSRGDMSRVMALFQEKMRLLDTIEKERGKTQKYNEQWQRVKKELSGSEPAKHLDLVLANAEKAIREFLEMEEILKKNLEHYMTREGTIRTS